MDDTSYQSAHGGERYQLTLTKAEIAFLNATIELMLEEDGGRIDSVTIGVDSAAAFTKALVKTAKKVNQWVEKNGGWLAVAALATDLLGFTADSPAVTREQADALQRFRSAARQGVSLEELMELRNQFEAQSAGKPPTSRKSRQSKE